MSGDGVWLARRLPLEEFPFTMEEAKQSGSRGKLEVRELRKKVQSMKWGELLHTDVLYIYVYVKLTILDP